MRIRILLASLLIATAVALAAPITAKAIPPGMYFLQCKGGKANLYNIIGNSVASGVCWGGDWIVRVIVSARVAQPDPPRQDPPDNPAWMGLSAQQWVANIAGLSQVADGETTDPTGFNEVVPTLTCNEADFDDPNAGN